jgi:hypothetical protein
MAGETLVLEATDFKDPQHWRWVLKDSNGKFLQDFEVGLDSNDPNYGAFLDLYSFLEANSAPDRWLEDQTRLIRQVGAWIGKEALGRVVERIDKFSSPVTVKVLVPPEASGLLYRPWEIAMVGDKPLAMRNVSLVFEMKGEKPFVSPVPIQDRLRMLAVFSLPTNASALSLRRERYEIMKLINQLAQASGYAIEMRVLQYGTTRESLQEALEEGEGWDLIHFSGHGDKATLILEKPDGSHDPVTSQELSALLSLASGRLKLVTLSACLSAAATIQETLSWLKIEQPERSGNTQACASARETPMPALALEVMTKLDCAALAMRYPVGDEFAINLATELYRLMLEKGNTLTRSLQLAMQKALKDGYNAATPPLSLATPALFGSKAADMIIKPPQAQAGEFRMPTIGLAYFQPEPKRFVGRTGPLGRASSALAKDSDKRGVLFHGMAGAGKTSCALELAYHQRRSPRFMGFVWHEAPKEGSDIEGALSRLALDMEKQLPGFKMAHLVDRAEDFRAWLPVLSETLEQNSVLIVLDNLENLLTSDGGWKDDRWGWLVEALLDHEGLSRIILTSRKLPKELVENGRLLIEPINALSLNEAALLAREMPHLGRLLLGKSTLGLEKGRELVKRTLSLVQGHPKLIELADAQAADPACLEKYLGRAVGGWSDSESHLDRFFRDGESARTAEEFLKVLTRWTKDVSGSLPESSRTLFRFMCALEDEDRQDWIVKQIWPGLWKALGYSSHAPGLDQALSAIKSAGLAEPQSLGEQVKYAIHPGVAQAGLEEADKKFRSAVDSMMGFFWMCILDEARSGGDQEKGRWIITAGLRSAPYLIRQKMWDEASTMLEQAILRDKSPETIALILPLLRYIAQSTKGIDRELIDYAVLAKALLDVGRWQEAEHMLRSLIPEFVAKGDFILASNVAGDLINNLQQIGRFEEALELNEERKAYILQAGLGPWTQFSCQGQKLHILNFLGRSEEVLEIIESIRLQIRSLPEKGDQYETATFWSAKETILDAGRSAALRSGKYELALELNAEQIETKKSRGAPPLDLTRANFNDHGPLLQLKRYDEAERLLLACKAVFEEERSIEGLGAVFSALAHVMYESDQLDRGVSYMEMSLRYKYLFGDPNKISIGHNNLAVYLRDADSLSTLAHSLAAVFIDDLIKSGSLASDLRALAWHLDKFGLEALPGSFAQLCDQVERIDGVRFRELLERLPKGSKDGDKLMKELVQMARSAGL